MISYFENIRNTKATIEGFCNGWKKPLSEIQIKDILKNSSYNVVAIDNEKIVGIITALSDDVNWAFIPYLEVLEEYQGKGIGKELTKRMLEMLDKITCVDLTCDIERQSFYEQFGMLKSSGMVLRKYLG